jgi:glycosyltransferase involved in cell wall biosynthesis
MRILLIHQYFHPLHHAQVGRWNAMARVWAELGHEITVIAGAYDITRNTIYDFCKGKFITIEDEKNGVRVIRVHTSENYNKNFVWRTWAYFTFCLFGLIGVLVHARGKYDVVIASSPPLTVGPLGIAISFLKRIPFVFEARDLWPDGAIKTGVVTNPLIIKLMFFMEKVSYRKARFINVLTPAFKDRLIQDKGVPAEKVWMIPNAADLDVIKPGHKDEEIRKKHNWGDKFVGLYTGAHGRMNCLWQLIEAAKILRTEPEYLIVCIGSGMERDALMRKAAQEKLTNIQFLPAVNREVISTYINSCDVALIVLQKNEVMKEVYPNKMFDSMSAAKPIILAIDGVARKLVVDDAHCGVYVEPENAERIAEKMRFYRNSPQLAEEHGQNGHKYVCENYDRKKLAAEYIGLVDKCIVNSRTVCSVSPKR